MASTPAWKFLAVVVAAIMIVSLGAGVVTPGRSEAASPIYVDSVRPDDSGNGTSWATAKKFIQSGINIVDVGGVINVAAGTYTENVNVDKSLTLQGASSATVVVNASSPIVSVFNITASSVNISGFTATGTQKTGNQGYAGIKFGNGVTNCSIHDNVLSNNQYGILMIGLVGNTTPGNNMFTNNTASSCGVSGIEMQNTYGNTFTNNIANSNGSYGLRLANASNNTFTGNTANSNGSNGFSLVKASGTTGSSNNTFTNNTANSNTSYGLREDYGDLNVFTGNTFDANLVDGVKLKETITNITLNNNTITNNPIGIEITFSTVKPDVTSWAVHNNNISGNTNYGIYNLGNTGTLNATNNWWGANDGPGAVGTGHGDKISANVIYNPWLMLNLTGNPASIPAGGGATSSIIADMTKNSAGAASGGFVPNGTQIVFTTTSGSIGSLTTTKTTTSGIATATLTAAGAPGMATLTATAPGDATYAKVTTIVTFAGSAPKQVDTLSGTVTIAASTGSLETITHIDLSEFNQRPPWPVNPYGVISFTVSNLAAGTTVTMIFTLPNAPPAILQFWKYINGAWVDCTSLISGVDDGDNVVFVTIKDGGFGDEDGLANGRIVDPCCFIIPLMPLTTSHGSSIPATTTPQQPVLLPNVLVKSAAISGSSFVTAEVINLGVASGSSPIVLSVDGKPVDSQVVNLAPGDTTTVKFNVSKIKPGKHEITVNNTPVGSLTIGGWASGYALIFIAFIAVLLLTIGLLVFYVRRKRTV